MTTADPREPNYTYDFSDFNFLTQAENYDDLEAMDADVAKYSSHFYKYFIDNGGSKEHFVALMSRTAFHRTTLQLGVVAREAERTMRGVETPMSDQKILQEAWYDSFMQSAQVSAMIADKTDVELRALRKFAYEKLFELHDSLHGDLTLADFVNAINWYSHVVLGTSTMLGESVKEATDVWGEIVHDHQDQRRQLEHFEFVGHKLYLEKIDRKANTANVRHATRYVTEGLEEDADAALRAYLDVEYINALQEELTSLNKDRTESFTLLADIMKDYVSDGSDAAEEPTELDLEKFKPTELDWEVLPPGKLKDFAVDIVEGAKTKRVKEVRIDPLRLKALEAIREQWGADKAFYVKGALKARQKRIEGSTKCPDQYIILVLQEYLQDGRILEHAVAESPIAGEHAMYLFRQDVNPDVNWRKVMSLDKQEARTLGARPIKHPSAGSDDTLPEVMADRVSTLLTATPEEFLHIEFRGKRGFVLRKALAIKAFAGLAANSEQASR